MVELPQLRASERIGVRGCYHGGQTSSSGGTRVCEDGGICARCPHERPGEIFSDVLIDQADAKRRCIEATQMDGSPSVRNSRYGLQCVCLGEASHPGPPGRRSRDSAEELLDNLERELESDDEPLVRPTIGQNVVPRIGAGEPILEQHNDSLATVPASPRALEGVARRHEVHDVAPPTVPAQSPLSTWVDRELDECSVQSESCWGEMEDRRDGEVEEWGLVPHPGAVLEGREVPQVGWARAVRAPLEVNQGRFAALARVDRDDEPADAHCPWRWVRNRRSCHASASGCDC